ncbi:MAG: hypothetical protein R2932_55275 [Caldilineaceae bacterium]
MNTNRAIPMLLQRQTILLIMCAVILCFGLTDVARAQMVRQNFTVTRVSVATDGREANDEADLPDIAGNGRYVVFVSAADNLVPGDNNQTNDIFVHDRQTGQTARVSVASDGTEATGFSTAPAISDDGRFVVFTSGANNLIPNDINLGGDIFLRDLVNGTTELISVNSSGEQAIGNNYGAAISPDGAYVAFVSNANNLDPRTSSGFRDHIYLHNRLTGDTRLLSVNAQGEPGDDRSGNFLGGGIAVSNGGTYVAFVSTATNLVSNDTNDQRDIFLYRRALDGLERISVGPNGLQANGSSWSVHMSDDGQRILFDSDASNLVAQDSNERTDLFLFDLARGSMRLTSKGVDGGAGEGADGDISGDGRYVVYASNTGQHLANDCTVGLNCVYRYDTLLDQTILVSTNATGGPAGNHTQTALLPRMGTSLSLNRYGMAMSPMIQMSIPICLSLPPIQHQW